QAKQTLGRGTIPALEYQVVPNTSIITISAEGTDKADVASWANAAAHAYVDLTKKSSSEALENTKQYLQEKVEDAEHRLKMAERKLLKFKSDKDMGASVEENAARVEDALDLEAKAREARNEVITLNVKIQGVKSRLAREPELLKEPKVQLNPEVEAV